jgi:hypothetical protein
MAQEDPTRGPKGRDSYTYTPFVYVQGYPCLRNTDILPNSAATNRPIRHFQCSVNSCSILILNVQFHAEAR